MTTAGAGRTLDGEPYIEIPIGAFLALHWMPIANPAHAPSDAERQLRASKIKALRLMLPLFGPCARARALATIANLAKGIYGLDAGKD